MSDNLNCYGQEIGFSLPEWRGVSMPDAKSIDGKFCVLERINAIKHVNDLYESFSESTDGRDWTYLPLGPFDSIGSYEAYLLSIQNSVDPMHFAIIDKTSGKAVGTVALMRIDDKNGVIEIGYVIFSGRMKKTRIATESIVLLLRYVFNNLGYRRVEWKCDSLNIPSRSAAERLGFKYEGVFRQHIIYRNRNRDTAWFSIIDVDFYKLDKSYHLWLDERNFSKDGIQIKKLSSFIIDKE